MSDNAATLPREKTQGQISNLPGVTTYFTGHNGEGQAIVQEKRPANWSPLDKDQLAFNVAYTTNFPADLNNSMDIKAHDNVLKDGNLGLVKKNGVVCRQVRANNPQALISSFLTL